MPRFSIALMVAFLGAISATAATLWIIGHRSPPHAMKSEDVNLKQAPDNQEITFADKLGAKGTTKDGAPFSTHVYESSDGVVVSIMRENRDSPTKADRALQKRLKRAIRIIERGSTLDEKGQRVGERVVAMFALDNSQKEQASVLWTNGQQLYYIESLSLKHALEFERQFYK